MMTTHRPQAHLSNPAASESSGKPNTLERAIFYHAGCPICVEAEAVVSSVLDPNRFVVEPVHLSHHAAHQRSARAAGVASVPALVVAGKVFHLGATFDWSDLLEQ